VSPTVQAAAPVRPPTSLFANGHLPHRRVVIALIGACGGLLLAYLWTPELVDDQIGFNTANTLLSRNAEATPVGGVASGILFAFVTGLAGSFTACNIACFGAVGPLLAEGSRAARIRSALRPLGWIAAGMLPVSAVYGALVGIMGTHLPQFSNSKAAGLTPRAVQSMVAFGVVGLVMIVLGLAAAGMVPDPMARVARRFPNAPLVLLGALIGGFLIGRPYPLFHELFQSAATSHDPFYGAAAFALQSLGNIIVMSLLFLLLTLVTGRRVRVWLAADPARISALTAISFLVAGFFSVAYWDLRTLSQVGDFWFPTSHFSFL
jgi:hypothetical protein